MKKLLFLTLFTLVFALPLSADDESAQDMQNQGLAGLNQARQSTVLVSTEQHAPGQLDPAAAPQATPGTFSGSLTGSFTDQSGTTREMNGSTVGVITEN